MANMDIQKLIKIADSLDDKGFIKEAEEIDQLIHMASITIKNMQGLLTVLKDTFAEAVNNPNLPSVTKESLHDIFPLISKTVLAPADSFYFFHICIDP